jgi:phosphate-selective porin OprO and OprP
MAIRFRSALPGALCLGLLTTAAFAQTTPVELPLGPVESVQSVDTVQTVETEPFAPVEESPGSIADGIRLDEAIRPLAGYFQVGGATGATGGAKPKYPLINVSGAAQIDAIWFNQDAANEAVVGDAQDVAGFRRSRLGVNGNLAENVAYRMEYDFSFPGRPNFTDVWADLSDLPWAISAPASGSSPSAWRRPRASAS